MLRKIILGSVALSLVFSNATVTFAQDEQVPTMTIVNDENLEGSEEQAQVIYDNSNDELIENNEEQTNRAVIVPKCENISEYSDILAEPELPLETSQKGWVVNNVSANYFVKIL